MNGDHWLLYLINPPSGASERVQSSSITHDSSPRTTAVSQANGHGTRQDGARDLEINVRRPLHEHQDQTLEILMTHLSPDARAPFFHPPELDMNHHDNAESSTSSARSGHYLGSLITQHLGIDKLFDKDESIIDSFGFEPCGYSANGIIGSGSGYPSAEGDDREGGGYWTIHVTPEEGWSFASFECNVPLPLKNEGFAVNGKRSHRPDLKTLIRRVVDIFEPGRLSITLFLSAESENALLNANSGSGYSNPSESSSLADSGILADSGVLEPAHETEATRRAWTAFSKSLLGEGYVRKDRIGYEFEDYDLVFGCFEKRGFKRALRPHVS